MKKTKKFNFMDYLDKPKRIEAYIKEQEGKIAELRALCVCEYQRGLADGVEQLFERLRILLRNDYE